MNYFIKCAAFFFVALVFTSLLLSASQPPPVQRLPLDRAVGLELASVPTLSILTAAGRRDEFGRPTCADRARCVHCRGDLPLSPFSYPAIGCRGMLQRHHEAEPHFEASPLTIYNRTGMEGFITFPDKRYELKAKGLRLKFFGGTSIYGSNDCFIGFPPHLYSIPKSFFRTTLTLERVNPDRSLIVHADENEPAFARVFVLPRMQAVRSTLVLFNKTSYELTLTSKDFADYRRIKTGYFCIISAADLVNYCLAGMRLLLSLDGKSQCFFDVPQKWVTSDGVQAIIFDNCVLNRVDMTAHTLRQDAASLTLAGIDGLGPCGRWFFATTATLRGLDPSEGIPVVEEFDVAPREFTSGLASLLGAESDE